MYQSRYKSILSSIVLSAVLVCSGGALADVEFGDGAEVDKSTTGGTQGVVITGGTQGVGISSSGNIGAPYNNSLDKHKNRQPGVTIESAASKDVDEDHSGLPSHADDVKNMKSAK